MSEIQKCPKCGKDLSQAITDEMGRKFFICGSYIGRGFDNIDGFHQSWSCQSIQISQLKARNEKLEDFVRVVKQANDDESGLDGFEKKVLQALANLGKTP